MYERHYMVCTNGNMEVWLNRPFPIIVTKYADVSRRVTKGEVVASVIRSPTQVVEATVTLATLLGDDENKRSERMEPIQFDTLIQQQT